jgi:hypothetical protein
MDSGNYDPYFLATIQDNYSGKVILTGAPISYELSDLELTITLQMPAFLDLPFYRTSIQLARGALIAGVPYTVSTSNFCIINSTWDGNFQTFKCHLIPRLHYSAPGDQTYQQVIHSFCTAFGKTDVYLDPAAAWLSYQFLPTGKPVSLNNAQSFFQTLKQKYFIFACDNGNDQILFYTAFTHVATPQYSITGYRFSVDYNVDQRRQYIWRDENDSLHRTVPSFGYSVQPDAAEQSIMSLCDLGTGIVLAGAYKNIDGAGKIYRSTDYGLTWDAGYATGYAGIYSLLSLGGPALSGAAGAGGAVEGGIVLAAGYYGGPILRSTDWGVTWKEVQEFGVDTALALCDCGGGIVLCGHTNPAAIWKSVDYGLTWALAGTLGAESAVNSILYVGAGVCLSGTSSGGKIYRSTDYGSTWNLIRQIGTETGVYSLLGLGSGIVLAGTNPTGAIWKSSDAGLTWAQVPVGFSLGSTVYTLNTLGGGIVLAGTGPTGQVYRSLDGGASWKLVQQLGAELSVRSFLTLGNGSTLAGTGEHAYIFKSLNCAADLDIIHNLGFMPSTAVEPCAYFLLAQPRFDPFPVHLKYQSSDFIRVNLPPVGAAYAPAQTYDFTCCQVTEILSPSGKSEKSAKSVVPFRMEIGQTEWLSNTAAGPMPGTIDRVAAYTPLVTTNFDGLLNAGVNNLQALADAVDDLVVDTRETLKANRTYYVKLDGSDSNDGHAATAQAAFATIQHAWDVVCGLDMSTFQVTIKVGNGTHTHGLVISNSPLGTKAVQIIGDEAAPANVIWSVSDNILLAVAPCNVYVSGFKLQTDGSGCNGIYLACASAQVGLGNINFGSMTLGDHIVCDLGGKLTLYHNYTISGNAVHHMRADNLSEISSGSITITLTGNPNFSGAFAQSTMGLISLYVPVFSGSATGLRYYIVYNAFLNTFTAVTLPGSLPGISGAGGQVA